MTAWTVAFQALLSMGFPRQEYFIGLPFPFLGDLPNPGIKLASLALADGFFNSEPPGKPPSAVTTEEGTFPLGRVLEPCGRDRVKDQTLEQSVFFSFQELQELCAGNRDRDQCMYFLLSHKFIIVVVKKSFLNISFFHCHVWAFPSCGECGYTFFFVVHRLLVVMASFTV